MWYHHIIGKSCLLMYFTLTFIVSCPPLYAASVHIGKLVQIVKTWCIYSKSNESPLIYPPIFGSSSKSESSKDHVINM